MLNFIWVTFQHLFSSSGVFNLEYKISKEVFERLKQFQEKKKCANIDRVIDIIISNLDIVFKKTLWGRYDLLELPIAEHLVDPKEKYVTKFKLRSFNLRYILNSIIYTFSNPVFIKFEADYQLYLRIVRIKFLARLFCFDDVLKYALLLAKYLNESGKKRKEILLVSRDSNKAYGLIEY